MFVDSPSLVPAQPSALPAHPLATPASGWRAHLSLGYALRGGRTVLTRREHDGPLIVQKALYPEQDGVCHTILVHPPGGIAGGDRLHLDVELGAGTATLLTTPGATKWYRSTGLQSSQQVRMQIGAGACMEWLPQESIVFDATLGRSGIAAHLDGDASYIGWDILCMGRTASGEKFSRGVFRFSNEIFRAGQPLWIEQGRLTGDDPVLGSPAGMDRMPVCATLAAASDRLTGAKAAALVAACRAVQPENGLVGVTLLPGVLLARYLGPATESARRYFIALWTLLRPSLMDRPAALPRIWNT